MARIKQVVPKHPSSASKSTRKGRRKATPVKAPTVRKKRRFKPGTRALKDIRKLQKDIKSVFKKRPFLGMVREIMAESATLACRINNEAVEALMEAAQELGVEVMGIAQDMAVLDGHVSPSAGQIKYAGQLALSHGRRTCPNEFWMKTLLTMQQKEPKTAPKTAPKAAPKAAAPKAVAPKAAAPKPAAPKAAAPKPAAAKAAAPKAAAPKAAKVEPKPAKTAKVAKAAEDSWSGTDADAGVSSESDSDSGNEHSSDSDDSIRGDETGRAGATAVMQ